MKTEKFPYEDEEAIANAIGHKKKHLFDPIEYKKMDDMIKDAWENYPLRFTEQEHEGKPKPKEATPNFRYQEAIEDINWYPEKWEKLYKSFKEKQKNH